MKQDLAPIRGKIVKNPWQGSCKKKPWEYKITAVIPCLDTYEQLKICTDLLRLQTEKPYIMAIDTGSCPEQRELISSLREEDFEVHQISLNGVLHPSDFPAMAMDFAFTLCRTPYLFATHADCFLRRKNFLEDLLAICQKHPVAGYQISPRSHSDWKGMVSHTATMYHMATMDKIGFGWSMRRLCNIFNISDHRPVPARPNWPDTEILGNYIMRQYKIKPYLIGEEKNFSRQVDDNIDHFRSYTSGKLYSPGYYKRVSEWYEAAKEDALKRIENWKNGE